jgi:hypothetical protein
MNKKLICSSTLALLLVGPYVTEGFAQDQSPRGALADSGVSRHSEKEIQKAMAEVLKQILDKDFSGVVNNLSKGDRERIGANSKSTPDAMKSLVAELRQNWKAKYGHDLDIDSASIPYEITASQQDVAATVLLPSEGAIPAVTIQLIDEGTVMSAWRVDIPDSVTNLELKNDLAAALTALNKNVDSWPFDEKTAYRQLAESIFSALNGQAS